MNSPLHRQLLTAVAILGGMGFAFVVSNHVPSGAPKHVSNDNFIEPSQPEAEGGVIEAWLFRRRAYPNRSLPPGDQERMWRESMKAVAPQSFSLDDLTTADHWSNIGPASVIGGQIEGPIVADPNPRVSGRIRDIAVDPNNVANHWFIATEMGGVWETTDGGGSWTPKTDAQLSLAMKTITIAPSNPQILFATNRDSSGSILKSLDGGASWAIQSSFPNSGSFYFAGLEVHPTHPNIVMAVIYNGIQAVGGVYKSNDGGTNFAQTMLVGPGTDLTINPQSFNQQYAAIRSEAGSATYNGIYRSLDEGVNWTRLTGLSGPWEPISPGWGARIAIAPSNPDTAYVVVPGGPGPASAGGLWKTNNAWATTPTWTAMPMCVQGAETVIVDPTDPNTLYIGAGGGENFFRISGPCGTCPCTGSWVSIQSGTHVDNYVLKAAGSTILVGNDGGLWSSPNQGTSWYNKNSNLSTIQFYAGSLHPTRGTGALGGSQDNGTEFWNANQAWDFVYYGDGGCNAFAYSNSDPDHRWLVSFLDVNPSNTLHIMKVRVTGAPPYTQYVSDAMNGIDRTGAAVIAPIKRSPNSDVVLAGADNLFKSTDFFTAADPSWTVNSLEIGSPIAAIAFAPSDTSSLTYAFGTTIGEMRITTQGGTPLRTGWKNLDPWHTLQYRWVTGMAFHPTDPNTIYVTLSGAGTGHIFKTTNALSPSPTWTNVSPSSDVRMNAVAVNPANPNIIFAGSDLGVWKLTYTGGVGSWSWMGPDNGMPNVPVGELLFSPVDGLLVAFTGGRGAFKLNAGSLQVTLTPPGAVLAGAKWNVDGGPFQTSGTILPGLAPGNHTVTFSPAVGYLTPANQTVTISANQTTQTTGVYQGGQ